MLLQHFRGNLDNWDPALTDALAAEREVILVDYPGAGASSGAFGPTIAATARRIIAFVEALELEEIDLMWPPRTFASSPSSASRSLNRPINPGARVAVILARR